MVDRRYGQAGEKDWMAGQIGRWFSVDSAYGIGQLPAPGVLAPGRLAGQLPWAM